MKRIIVSIIAAVAIAGGIAFAQSSPVKNFFSGCVATGGGCDNVLNIGGTLKFRNRGTVTQITTLSTGVTLNATSGTITTVSQTLAAGAEAEFTVTDSAVGATDAVIVNLADIAGGTGGPFMVSVTAVAAGSFNIAITNTHSATAGNSVLKLNFAVVKSAA